MGRLTTGEFVARLRESRRGNRLPAAVLALLLPSLCPVTAAAPDGQAWRQDGAGGYERIDLPGTAAGCTCSLGPASRCFGRNEGLHECSTRCVAFEPAIGHGVRSLRLEREDGVERLWVGTHGDGLRTYTRTSGTPWQAAQPTLRRENGLPNDIVLALSRVDPGGPLWIGTGHGVARWDGERLSSFSANEGLPRQ